MPAGLPRFGDALREGVPGQGGALDADREFDHAPQRLEVAQADVAHFGLDVTVAAELLLVDGHHGLEGPGECFDLGESLAFHRRGHHRRR